MASAASANGVQSGGNMQAFGNVLGAISSLAVGDSRRSIANSQADTVMAGATMRARAIRRAAQQETGSARAAAAASGVKVSSGSVLAAENDIARYSEQDAMTVLLSAKGDAQALRLQGRQAMQAGVMGAVDSLIHGGDAWQRTRRNSAFRMNDPYRVPGYVGGMEGE